MLDSIDIKQWRIYAGLSLLPSQETQINPCVDIRINTVKHQSSNILQNTITVYQYPPMGLLCAQQLQGHDTEVSPFPHQILYFLSYVVIKISYLKKPAKNNAYVFCSLKSGGALHHCIQICN